MEGHHFHHHQQQQRQQHQYHQQQQYHHHHQQQQQQQQQVVNPLMSGGGGGGGGGGDAGDRFPQWSVQETKEFLIIRADLDRSFMETKRNKLLWEVIATKMREKGFNRSAEQCKCKWKNLVTRYKGCETMEPEAMRQQFPFYNEMQAIFTARMQRLWTEDESGPGPSRKNKMGPGTTMSSDEEEEEGDSEGEHKGATSSQHKTTKKAGTSKKARTAGGMSSSGGNTNPNNVVVSSISAMKEMLEEFTRQQMQADAQWREAYEAREEERRRAEIEWRHRMEALENDRIMMERRWREKEEQRKMREEARAEKRDALITTLLNKLRRED